MRDYSFILWGSLWGLSEIFVWELLGILGMGSKAPIMAAISLFFMTSSSGLRPMYGLYTAITAVILKMAAGLYFPCSVWAVLSLGIAYELVNSIARLRKNLKYFLPSLSLPFAMLLFILVVNPQKVTHYAMRGGLIAFLLGIPALNIGLLVNRKVKLGLLKAGIVYLGSLLFVFLNLLLK